MLKVQLKSAFIFLVSLLLTIDIYAQAVNDVHKEAAKGLKLREIGPALMGGRISDIAVNPKDKNTWYVAAGSGNVWKTINGGITWKPIFDDQASYSIGCVTIDPNNPTILWVGTGENVSGRHVGWGDGVYRSMDAGKTWQHMGLKKSEHIGKILIDPRNSDVIMVAAEGPLWSAGGERGVYKSIDGGKSWNLALKIDENTGVTDIEFDPSNPDVVYAAAYQRRRHTWSLLAGGPKSGIYKSTDNGYTWKQVKTGLPSGDMGKIGLAVTAADPQRVFATIEANDEERGFYRSDDKGESWSKMNSYISGGTGPHYYQEIEASQSNPDLVYQMDVFLHVTRDGGKTFDYLTNGRTKHSDNHAMWIDPDNGNHLIAGTDGGLYESFDEGATWRHFENLPISQFYKAALDNSEPFYNVVVGAQDLGTLIGPSRTMNTEGVRNQDWYVPLGADGYDCAVDPTDPNIVYMEIQNGLLFRLDRRTEEVLMIQPQPQPNDPPERYNWDSPVLISPHDNKTLFFGSQRLWKSTDRGNSWTAISGDLTTNKNRYELKMMDNVPSVDALYDNGAMSKFSTLTSISESPIAKGLIYTGSDDGLIQVTEDGGQSWRKAQSLPKVPELSFINDIEASKHNANTVFASADAHKIGDYTTYLFMSSDRGKSWQAINGDLPANTIVWSIKQDHVDQNLLVIGTEYGIYYSPNKGTNWLKLGAGVPTIPFRDIELHERDNDLVGASFGRGVFVLDDYSALREAGKVSNNTLFPIRDAWWFVPNAPYQATGGPSAGSSNFKTPNPSHGALITYYISEVPKTSEEKREEKEKSLKEQGANIPFPGWATLKAESLEDKPEVLILIKDENGNAVRWLNGAAKKGVHRINWDLRIPAPDPISLSQPAFVPPWAGSPEGPMAIPGKYSAELYLVENGNLVAQGQAQEFVVKPTPNLPQNVNYAEYAAFTKQTNELSRKLGAAGNKLGEVSSKLRHIDAAITQTPSLNPEFFKKLKEFNTQLTELREVLFGDATRQGKDESTTPSISDYVWKVVYGHWNTTQLPTETQKQSIESGTKQIADFVKKFETYANNLAAFEKSLEEAGAPYTPGRGLE
ncbi:glycosyl hydrolase [Fulvivirga lutea]|uniref:Glycosyl hydrolase n=2 Tax=Fulvivirga lutea TaxID=2810512 RepID=A0A974WJ62_9BACT|nr:glycosyl hydrolase [Fulvivirga lutea]